jgi:4-aminobutyrate aminotransferase-like enzyme
MDAALELAARYWRIDGAIKPLPSYADQNFLIRGERGAFVLKLANASWNRDDLDLENQAMIELARTAPDYDWPRVQFTQDGRHIVTLDVDGEARHVRLLSYVPGRTYADAVVDLAPEQRHALHVSLGRAVASVNRGLASLRHHAADREQEWNLTNLPALVDEIAHIGDASLREIVGRHASAFCAALPSLAARLPQCVLHNDANDLNVIVGEANLVSAVIDFGDMCTGLRLAELAIACTYAMQHEDDPVACAQRIVEGYLAEGELVDAERESLHAFIMARLCQSMLMATRTSRDQPDNPHVFVSQNGVRALLRKLDNVPAAELVHAHPSENALNTVPARNTDELLRLRARHLNPTLSVAYREPLKIVRGAGAWLYDDTGRAYLDMVNNVCHVGHCHPRVVAAGQQQMAQLNTNTRYLHDNLVEYALRLTATLPAPLSVVFLTNSGSEANDLALRLVQAHVRSRGAVVVDHAYHGNLSSLIDLSPYKFNGRGGPGKPQHVEVAQMPDVYRGACRDVAGAGEHYARDVDAAIARLAERDMRTGVFLCESLLGCGGQIVLPDGYLAASYAAVRAAGGLCLADEVQVGFGRAGDHYWAFERQGVVPDIVTLGKPIANGHPMGAVVTTPEIAASFVSGMEYFNTYGGNPVSCAIALAVLDVIADEGLQQQAASVGAFLQDGLRTLQREHALIGDVRGCGLFIGAEIVSDRDARTPDSAKARAIVEAMKARQILLSTDGPDDNVLKIKPPLVFDRDNATEFLEKLAAVLAAA